MKTTILVTITLLMGAMFEPTSMAQNIAVTAATHNSAQQLAELIRNRPANEGRVGNMHFILRNAKGNERKRSALLIHSEHEQDIKIAIFFTSPAALQDTVFLSHDYALQEDENWLYLPATKRVRRIPSANRGDYFMGTDLTYGDIKDDFKFSAEDWDFSLGETSTELAKGHAVLLGMAKNATKKSELGYASFYALVDLNSYIPVDLRYTDTDGKPLKEMVVHKQELVGGAWTPMQFTIKQLQLSHQTNIVLEDMRYMPNLPEAMLSPESLSYGLPQL